MRIGVLTGGGDAPGTNADIRAVVKALIRREGAEVVGIEDGYLGLIERRVRPLDWRAVSGIVAQGGTLLGTTNRVNPLAHEGRDRRPEVLAHAQELALDGVVAIGGDGTLAIAAAELSSAAALGKPVRIGQETTYLGTDPTEVKQTFYGQTLTRMDDQLAQVDSGASAYASYAGIAVHDFPGYAAMAP
jgi:6-phosphofructokinase 1